jgi:hypothetical protein
VRHRLHGGGVQRADRVWVPGQVVTRLDPFVAAVLPAVFVLGEFTFAALLRNTLENLVLLRQMQRIRGYYRSLVPEADQFFGPAAEDERFSAAMATVGLRAPRPAHMGQAGVMLLAEHARHQLHPAT